MGRRKRRRGRCIVGLEDVEALELLVENSEGLKFFGLDHLLLEPILDLILLDLFEVFVVVIEVSLLCQNLPDRVQKAYTTDSIVVALPNDVNFFCPVVNSVALPFPRCR